MNKDQGSIIVYTKIGKKEKRKKENQLQNKRHEHFPKLLIVTS